MSIIPFEQKRMNNYVTLQVVLLCFSVAWLLGFDLMEWRFWAIVIPNAVLTLLATRKEAKTALEAYKSNTLTISYDEKEKKHV